MYKYRSVEKAVDELDDIECCICGNSCAMEIIENFFELLHVLINLRKVAYAASTQSVELIHDAVRGF